MNDVYFIKHGLQLQGVPIYENDIPYIQEILDTIHQAQASLDIVPYLNTEVPITVVDKRLIR